MLGFTAVTGETGAGKSVLLGALGLLSGARTDKTMIRQGTDQLEVEAALYFEDSAEMDACWRPLGCRVAKMACCCYSVVFIARKCRVCRLMAAWRHSHSYRS